MPAGILAEAKFTSWDEGIVEGTVYEICQVKQFDSEYELMFYDDNGNMNYIFYYLDPKYAVFNNDMFQLYFQF